MDNYITAETIKRLRTEKGLTQAQLAQTLDVSDKAVSKWETGRGLPDISLIEPLSKALGVSVIELISGECAVNRNRSGNMLRSKFYVCPVCGNVLHSLGESTATCCGVKLPPLEAEDACGAHSISCSTDGYELYVTIDHPMTKQHYISFVAYVTDERTEMVKLYPEQSAAARFTKRSSGRVYAYCNKDGLFSVKVK